MSSRIINPSRHQVSDVRYKILIWCMYYGTIRELPMDHLV